MHVDIARNCARSNNLEAQGYILDLLELVGLLRRHLHADVSGLAYSFFCDENWKLYRPKLAEILYSKASTARYYCIFEVSSTLVQKLTLT